jgi:hypothetical protein
MKSGLAIASAGEAGTGLALLVAPAFVARLLFGSEPTGIGTVAARFAGIALIGLGAACWPGLGGEGARRGMLVYGVLATCYLAYLGVSGGPAGPLLWPAVALHVVLILMLARHPSHQRRTVA